VLAQAKVCGYIFFQICKFLAGHSCLNPLFQRGT
jgi:hypothetical protein